jgi:putative FmdB family regulatory protein
MPTYEYRCRECGEPLEVVQSFNDDPLEVCPSCGGSLRKVFGAVGISFKGSGFYKTDSRSSSGTKSSTSTSSTSSESATGSSSSGSSESGSGDTGSGGATPAKTDGASTGSSSTPSTATKTPA